MASLWSVSVGHCSAEHGISEGSKEELTLTPASVEKQLQTGEPTHCNYFAYLNVPGIWFVPAQDFKDHSRDQLSSPNSKAIVRPCMEPRCVACLIYRCEFFRPQHRRPRNDWRAGYKRGARVGVSISLVPAKGCAVVGKNHAPCKQSPSNLFCFLHIMAFALRFACKACKTSVSSRFSEIWSPSPCITARSGCFDHSDTRGAWLKIVKIVIHDVVFWHGKCKVFLCIFNVPKF